MENKLLTVAITTYNRKQSLLEVLRSLECQGQYDKYEIVISNNHSDYDVNEWLDHNLSSDFLEIITVINREYNVGGDINISFIFQYVKTPWMWLASDDDPSLPNALSTLFTDINNNQDLCWIKYSIGGYNKFRDVCYNNLKDVLWEICRNDHFYGELVFMGNNVYNMVLIKKYIGAIPFNAKTSMPHLLAPFLAISRDQKYMMYSSHQLTNYVDGRRSYTLLYAFSNFGNLLYSDILLTKKDIEAFKKIKFANNRQYVKALLTIDDRSVRWEYFKKIFIAHFRLFSFRAFSFLLMYHFVNNLPDFLLKKLIHNN